MAVITGGTSAVDADVDTASKGLNVVMRPRDVAGAYRFGQQSGIIAAATAANSLLFAMRNGPTANTKRCFITRVHIIVQVVTAPSAAAALALQLVRFSVANTSGGTAGVIFTKKPYATSVASACTVGGGEGGDIRIATTGALTVTGVTIDTLVTPMLFVNCTTTTPAIGNRIEYTVENDAGLEHPIELAPGEGLAISNSVATPTALTFVMGVAVAWSEK
jgi:hypothetical protein